MRVNVGGGDSYFTSSCMMVHVFYWHPARRGKFCNASTEDGIKIIFQPIRKHNWPETMLKLSHEIKK
jgi:hypothetical protein